ncbi:hypothetical protein BKA66DRAFT_577131 [Pyrenochaeta sp. MPI-SDFR-AT-0127]|nr:hypothetical protein BKA66DRAFT_577131 [Pyrenochaeta sp. MPI-SDFR-AT-0127]
MLRGRRTNPAHPRMSAPSPSLRTTATRRSSRIQTLQANRLRSGSVEPSASVESRLGGGTDEHASRLQQDTDAIVNRAVKTALEAQDQMFNNRVQSLVKVLEDSEAKGKQSAHEASVLKHNIWNTCYGISQKRCNYCGGSVEEDSAWVLNECGAVIPYASTVAASELQPTEPPTTPTAISDHKTGGTSVLFAVTSKAMKMPFVGHA